MKPLAFVTTVGVDLDRYTAMRDVVEVALVLVADAVEEVLSRKE